MVARKQLAWAELKVGVFVTLALGLLAFFIIKVSWGGKLFAFAPKQFYAKTYLPSVERLKPGSPVWLSGLEVGYVTNVEFVSYNVYPRNQEILGEINNIRAQINQLDKTKPDYKARVADLYDQIRNKKLELRTVEITMKIDNQYRRLISRDSEVSIGSQGLIGESYIDISVGSFGEPLKTEFDPKLKQPVAIIEGVSTKGIREILTGANDVVANFAVLSDQMKRIANNIDIERVGQTISSVGSNLDRTFKEAEVALNRANKLIADVQTGRGTIGKFMVDPGVYNKTEETLRNLNDVTDKIKSGNGSLARFLNDGSVYNEADVLLKRVDTVAGRIENGQGTLGLLTTDRALYDRTTRAIERLTNVAERIDRGEGTLGRLTRDETMYNNVNQTMSEVSKLIYDFRQNPKKYLTINFKIF